MNVLERIDRGECDVSITEYIGPNSEGRPHDVYRQELIAELLRLARLGAAAEKCVCNREPNDDCKAFDKYDHDCLMLDFCRIRAEKGAG